MTALFAATLFIATGIAGGHAAGTAASMDDDITPPDVTILSPEEGYIHFAGIQLFRNPFGLTMTMGAFLFKPGVAVAVDNVDHPSELAVTVSLDGKPAVNAYFVPCDNTFEWTGSLGPGFGIYTLTVTAEDTSGNMGSAELQVFYDCILPASG
jgi:hypothetical protein